MPDINLFGNPGFSKQYFRQEKSLPREPSPHKEEEIEKPTENESKKVMTLWKYIVGIVAVIIFGGIFWYLSLQPDIESSIREMTTDEFKLEYGKKISEEVVPLGSIVKVKEVYPEDKDSLGLPGDDTDTTMTDTQTIQ